MKKIISIIALVFVLALSLTSCDMVLDMVGGLTDPNKQEYNNALKLIEEKKYEEAYDALKKLEGYEPAEKELENFHFVPVSFKIVDCKNNTVEISYEGEYDGNLLMEVSTTIYSSDSHSTISKTECSYDSMGNWIYGVRKLNGGTQYTITQTFDENNRLVKSLECDSFGHTTTTEYTYNSEGYVIKEVQTKETTYTNYVTTITEYTYDSNGNLTKEVVDNGTTSDETTYTYDSNGNLTKILTPEGEITEYTYDSNGNLVKETNVERSITYSYDSNGNITKAVYTYSEDTTTLKYTYDENGHITKLEAEDEEGVLTFECDKYGNITKMVLPEENHGMITVEWKLAYYPYGIPGIVEQFCEVVNQYLDMFGKLIM